MTGNPLSGHTNHNLAGMSGSVDAVDGLADGDHILSPSLTNLYEGIHGNGILMREDTCIASPRNTPENLPGICEQVTNVYTFTVAGGQAVLDGLVYNFAGGYAAGSPDVPASFTVELVSGSPNKTGSPSALTSGQEALVVVYVSSDGAGTKKNIYWEMGSPVTATTGYPQCPTSFLNYPSGSLSVKQSVVLAVMRVQYNSGGGDIKLEITEINDKRVFLKPTPIYFTPVTTGNLDATDAVNSATTLDNLHGGGVQAGGFAGSNLSGLWSSFGDQITSTTAGDNDKDVLYYSATHAARFTRSVFDRVLTSTATSIDLTAADANILVLTPGGTFTITTSGCFPAGYIIEIKNTHGSNTGTFALTNTTTSAIGDTADADGGYARFVCTVSHATNPTFVRLI